MTAVAGSGKTGEHEFERSALHSTEALISHSVALYGQARDVRLDGVAMAQ
jgi:hypothetical protein